MKRLLLLSVCSLASFVSAATPPAALPPEPAVSSGGVTLAQCYTGAKAISESLAISDENIRLVQAQYRGRVSAVLPRLDWIKSQFYQQNVSVPASEGGATSTNLRAVQPSSYFQLQQPLFSGGRDWWALGAAKSLELQAKFSRQQADETLLGDVAAAFFRAFSLQEQLTVLEQTRTLTADRVSELNRRVNLGKSRQSEVLSAQTQLASLDAQIQGNRRDLAEARQLLKYLSGVDTQVPLIDQPAAAPGLTVEDALKRSEKRPDLLATVEALNQADYGVRYAKGGFFPTLNLTGRYFTERIGFLEDVKWDATFLLDVPIFTGLSTMADVREAKAQREIARLQLSRFKRDIERQVRAAHDDLRYSVEQAEAYRKAVDLAQRNYEVQQKEYRLGLINNLEVLQVLTNLEELRQQWLISQATARLNDVRLRIAMGEGL